MVPLALGVRGLIKAIRAKDSDDQPPSAVACGLFSVASVTVANGADNISVYMPTFRTIGVSATLITVAVFAVLVALWCLIGSLLGSHKKIIEFVERYTFSELRMRTAHSSASAAKPCSRDARVRTTRGHVRMRHARSASLSALSVPGSGWRTTSV